MKALQKLRQNLAKYEQAPPTVENTVEICLHNLLIKKIEHMIASAEAEYIMEWIEEHLDEFKTVEDVYHTMHEAMREASRTIEEVADDEYESAIHSPGRTVFDGNLGRKSID